MSDSALKDKPVAPTYRPDIDGLRAVAVLAVIGFHAFPEAVPGGFTGVDVFFVISGYLISTIILENLQRGRFSFAGFYARRIRRIFPALALVLAAALALGWIALFAGEYAQLGKHVAAGAGFISNLVFWNEAGYFDSAAETKPLLHLWSLGVEEQFYIVWPALLWAGWRAGARLAGAIAALALLSFVLCVWLAARDATAAFYSPLTRLWELALGAWLACRAIQGRAAAEAPRFADLRSWVGMALIAFGVAAISRETVFPGAWTLAPTLGASLLLAAGPGAWLNRRLLSARPLVGIGLISYPLYLWHWPLLSFARVVEGAPPPAAIRVAALLASLVLASLTYIWAERPVRFGARPLAATTAVCVLMLVVGWAGYDVFRRGGIDSREAARAQAINRFDMPHRQGCAQLMGTDTADDMCNKGNHPAASPELVLIGDSFANTYVPMVASVLEQSGQDRTYRQFGRAQCPMLLDYGAPYCREIARRAMDYIRGTGSIRTVVLASAWALYEQGKPWPAHPETPEAYSAALDRTLRALRAMGKQPVVFLAPPIGSDPKACVVRPVRLTGEDHCTLSAARARYLERGYRERLLPLLDSLAVPYFDPFEYLCDGASCRMTDGQRILSADGWHLSAYGGEFLARRARARLTGLLVP